MVDAETVQMDLLDELKSILGSFPGEVPVVLQLTTAQGRHRLKVGNRYRVEPVSGLYAELKSLLGESCVRVGGKSPSASGRRRAGDGRTRAGAGCTCAGRGRQRPVRYEPAGSFA